MKRDMKTQKEDMRQGEETRRETKKAQEEDTRQVKETRRGDEKR